MVSCFNEHSEKLLCKSECEMIRPQNQILLNRYLPQPLQQVNVMKKSTGICHELFNG
jgi:hypothetical protein